MWTAHSRAGFLPAKQQYMGKAHAGAGKEQEREEGAEKLTCTDHTHPQLHPPFSSCSSGG